MKSGALTLLSLSPLFSTGRHASDNVQNPFPSFCTCCALSGTPSPAVCWLSSSVPCATPGTELGTQCQRHQGSDCPMLSTHPPSISEALTAALAPAKSGPCRFCRKSQGPTCSLPSLRTQGPAQKHSTQTSEQKHKDGERLPLLKDGKLLDFKNNLRRDFFFILEQAPRHCQIYLGGPQRSLSPQQSGAQHEVSFGGMSDWPGGATR